MELSLTSATLKHKFNSLRVHELIRWLPATLLLLLLGFTTLTCLFLYENFYQTIAEVKVVAILRSQVALNQVNLPLFDQVFTDWENKKKASPNPGTLRDPFASASTEPSSSTQSGPRSIQ